MTTGLNVLSSNKTHCWTCKILPKILADTLSYCFGFYIYARLPKEFKVFFFFFFEFESTKRTYIGPPSWSSGWTFLVLRARSSITRCVIQVAVLTQHRGYVGAMINSELRLWTLETRSADHASLDENPSLKPGLYLQGFTNFKSSEAYISEWIYLNLHFSM